MVKRKKRALKSIDSLKEQIEVHEKKIKEEDVDITIKDYWLKEIKEFKKQIEHKKKILEK